MITLALMTASHGHPIFTHHPEQLLPPSSSCGKSCWDPESFTLLQVLAGMCPRG